METLSPGAVSVPDRQPDQFLLANLTPLHRRRFEEGKALFNSRAFWEAHEAWEDVWKEIDDPAKRLVQGLIQAAAAYHLIVTRPRIGGALRNIEKSLDKFEGMPGMCFGVDIDVLRRTLQSLHREAARVGQDGLASIGDDHVARL